MLGGYLGTESSRDTSCCVGSLTISGIAVKECAGHSGLKSQSANTLWGMRFEECRPCLWTAVGSMCVSTNGRGLFVSPANANEKRPVLARKTVVSTVLTIKYLKGKGYFTIWVLG